MPDTTSMLQSVPGTPYVALASDSNLTVTAIKEGTIVLETSIANLPEVQSLGPGSVVIDCGALIGDTALIFIERGASVICIEPYPDAAACIRINCPTATVHEAAAGDGRPMRLTHQFGEDGTNYGTRMTGFGGDVPSLRIDDLSLPRLDFCKIDVEGAEPAVLDGMVETIKRCHPLLLIECYDTLLHKQGFSRSCLLGRIDKLGYDWKVAIGRIEDDRFDLLAWPR